MSCSSSSIRQRAFARQSLRAKPSSNFLGVVCLVERATKSIFKPNLVICQQPGCRLTSDEVAACNGGFTITYRVYLLFIAYLSLAFCKGPFSRCIVIEPVASPCCGSCQLAMWTEEATTVLAGQPYLRSNLYMVPISTSQAPLTLSLAPKLKSTMYCKWALRWHSCHKFQLVL